MTKLRLKRTPAEEHQRAQRKAYKAARRAAKRMRMDPAAESTSHQANSDDDGYNPSSSSHKPDYDAIRAELEEMRFREKMCDALQDDERLDEINARFNEYAHPPDRWAGDEYDSANPQHMDDDEYAEWIRQGMWKKKHAREYEEQAKRDVEKAARRARERELKADASRLERLALEREDRRRKERQRQREDEYRQRYERQWGALLDSQMQDHALLAFQDIPWPIFPPQSAERKISDNVSLRAEDITLEAITAFLLPSVNGISPSANDDTSRRSRDKVKETLLRFHPDKFDGRLMHRVLPSDVERVREAAGQVARVLNALMSGKS